MVRSRDCLLYVNWAFRDSCETSHTLPVVPYFDSTFGSASRQVCGKVDSADANTHRS
jgi:hypothetical protein